MLKNIKKECIIDEDIITITLSDPRDNYIHKNALGDIGNIFISEVGVIIKENDDYERKIEMLREKQLYQAFKEIFGTEEFNPLSNEYYEIIQTMIKNGALKALGYTIEYQKSYVESNSAHNKRH